MWWIFNSCKYSWSVDGVCWTSWASYSDYLNITKNLDNDFYLRILLFGDFDKLIINGCISNDYHISLDNTNIFLKAVFGSAFVTFIELVFGIFFNIILKQNVWNYSSRPFNFKGQICLLYSLYWVALSIIFIPLAQKVNNRLQNR